MLASQMYRFGDVVGLRPLVGDGRLRVVAEAADARFVQARPRAIGFGVGAPQFAAHRP